MRAIAWLAAIALAVLGVLFNIVALRVSAAFVVLGFFAVSAPPGLRPAIVLAILGECALLLAFGPHAVLDGLPVLISALVAWLFARTLISDRRPLIARAIAAIDGEPQLQDAAVARYARILTAVWMIYQTLLALCSALLLWHAHGGAAWLPSSVPDPLVFGSIVLPTAVAFLFLVEFALRPHLLPHVPQHTLPAFARELIRVWPQLLND